MTRTAPVKSRKPKLKRTKPLLLAFVVQSCLLLVTSFIVVVIPTQKSEPEFVASPAIHLPQRELEHRMALAEFEQVTASPPAIERLAADLLLPDGLPPMPALSDADFDPVESSEMAPIDARALLGTAALTGMLGQSQDSSASFFGIEDSGQRIVIVVNTSVSVVKKAAARGVTIGRIQDEMINLVSGLESSALFGIVQFSQGVRVFEDFLAPATQRNKEAVREWVPANLRGNPQARIGQRFYGHEAAFEAALAFEPEIIFLLTDGQLNRREGTPGNYRYPEIPHREFHRTLQRLQQEFGTTRKVRIHVVGFEMKPGDAEGMRLLANTFGGELRQF